MRAKITLIIITATLIYAILGGVAFHYIEQGYEMQLMPQVLHELSLYADERSCMNWSDFVLLSGLMEDMSDGGIYVTQSGQLLNVSKWDVRTAIFASISVLTSVGYHSLGPDFTGARIFCIFYGWIGIPFFYCANIVFAKLTVKSIKTFGRRICGQTLAPKTSLILTFLVYDVFLFGLFMLIPAVIFSRVEHWSYAESLYFCFSTLFTIGFGDYIPGFNRDVIPSEETIQWYRLATAFWVLILLFLFVSQELLLIAAIDKSAEKSEVKIDEKLSKEKEFEMANSAANAEMKWARGTSVMINGGGMQKTSWTELPSKVNPFSTTGCHNQKPNCAGFVSVVDLSQS